MNASVLDIGCGTGKTLENLPLSVEYVGIDLNESYLCKARQQWGSRGSFLRADLQEYRLSELNLSFDLVLAAGVFHHLSDEALRAMLSQVAQVLKPGGVLVSFDPCYHRKQRLLSRILVSADRGEYVRSEEGLTGILRSVFGELSISVIDDFLRIPYSHCLVVCRHIAG
jgi:cyclopropane fatty-acyl-phospholipid synthase-like methyltransferase